MPATLLLEVTFRSILSSIPTDGGAIVAYLAIAAFVWFMWKGSRPSAKPRTPEVTTTPDSTAPRDERPA